MSTKTTTALTAATSSDTDDTSTLWGDNKNGLTRKHPLSLLRMQANTGAQEFVASTAGALASLNRLTKKVTAIADATATDVLTITVPNAAHASSVRVTLAGSLGAGGAIGANEASGTVSYDIVITRTAGVNAVATISAAYGSGMASVAGAATITVTAAMSAVSGAVGAVNTFTVKTTITKGSGASANHTCAVFGTVFNSNATGVTLS